MNLELRDSLESIYPDSSVAAKPCRQLSLGVARGGTASVHVLANDLPRGEIRLATHATGIKPKFFQWFQLLVVPVEQNTGLIGFTENSAGLKRNKPNPHVSRKAPFRIYDAMLPVQERVLVDCPTMAFRLQVAIPHDALCETHEIDLSLTAAGETTEFRFTVQVHSVELPPVGRNSFPVTNWFNYANIAKRHGLTQWSATWWRMLAGYADLMVHGRQNTFWVPLSQIFSLRHGRLELNAGRLHKLVEVFTHAGMYFIEGGHVATRTGGLWQATTFDLTTTKTLATGPKGNAHLAAMGQQLLVEMDRYNWRPRWLQHVADEPVAANAADYRILVGMVRKYLPGIPILDATMDPQLSGSVDIWCPQVQEYQRHRNAFEQQRAWGDRIWCYTCCFPGGPWLNRLLDQELLRPLLIGWACALFDLDGFLHWGLNQYQPQHDPYQMSVIERWKGGDNALPAGDTHIIYPGKHGPLSSLRWEAQREGFEDLELLRLLKHRKPAAAARVLRPVVQGFDHYCLSVPVLRTARQQLFTALL